MKHFRQVTSLFLCLAMVAALAGCGKAGKPTKGENSGGLPETTVKVTIPGSTQKDYDKVAAEWNKYLKTKLNTRLTFDVIAWDGWRDKLTTMFASNADMDLIFTGADMQYYADAQNHAFLDLNELLSKYGQDIKKVENPLYLEGAKIDGKLYMIPTNKEIAEGHSMFFRKDIADKYGLDVSKLKGGIDELTPYLEEIKANEKDFSPLPGDVAWYGATTEMIENQSKYIAVPNYSNCYINIEDGKVYSKWDVPFEINKYKLYREWNQKGFFSRDIQDGKLSQDDATRTGKIWCWAGMNKPGEEKSVKTSFNLNTDLYMMAGMKPLISTHSCTGAGLAIRETSKNAERAMMVMNLLWSDDTLIHLVQDGIEGTHYVKVNDTQKKLPDTVKTTSDIGYNPGFSWMFGNLFQTYIWNDQDADQWQQYEKFNESGLKSPLLGFNFNSDPIKTEAAACGTVETTYVPQLDQGRIDVDQALNQVRKGIKECGVEKIKAEIQRQYDEWKKAQK